MCTKCGFSNACDTNSLVVIHSRPRPSQYPSSRLLRTLGTKERKDTSPSLSTSTRLDLWGGESTRKEPSFRIPIVIPTPISKPKLAIRQSQIHDSRSPLRPLWSTHRELLKPSLTLVCVRRTTPLPFDNQDRSFDFSCKTSKLSVRTNKEVQLQMINRP